MQGQSFVAQASVPPCLPVCFMCPQRPHCEAMITWYSGMSAFRRTTLPAQMRVEVSH